MLKDCGDVKIPEVPKFDASKLPTGVNLPAGMSVDSLKAKAENPGFSDRLKNAGNAIGANIKNTVSQLNPAAIADKAAGMVSGMVGNIKDSITHMADGLTSLKDKITGFDPAEKLKGLSPDSPAGMFENMKKQAKSKMDGLGSAFKNAGVNCGKAGLGAAGDVSSKATGAAAGALGGINVKDRIAMAKSPVVKQAKIEEATQQAAQETTTQVTEAATKPDKEKSVQQVLHSKTLPERLGVELGDCTGHVRESFLANALNAVLHAILTNDAGLYPSYANRIMPKEFFSVDHGAAAANVLLAIKHAAQVRVWGGILRAIESGYMAVCDDKPTKQGLINENMTYHDYMISNYYDTYSHDAPRWRIPSSYFAEWKPGFGKLHPMTLQQHFWQFWMRGADGFYDRYMKPAADLTNILTEPARVSTPGFWLHVESRDDLGIFSGKDTMAWFRDTVGKKPAEVFKESLNDPKTRYIMDTLTQDFKSSIAGVSTGENTSGLDQDIVSSTGGVQGFLSDSFRKNINNPAFIVESMPTGHPGNNKPRLFPATIMYAINFNFSSQTIDSVEYLGEDELLREHIK